MIRRSAVLAVAIGMIAGLGLFASPASAQYNPSAGCIPSPSTIDANTATPGSIDCVGCPPSSQANAFVIVDGAEVLIGSATVADDPDGSVSIPVVFPALPDGEFNLLVRCGVAVFGNVLTVVGTGGQQIGRLPVTGSDSSLLLQIALVLIVVGALFAQAARKRRHAYD